MPEQTRKLIHFTDTVLQEATTEAERTLDALEAQKTAALAYADRQAKQEALRSIRAESARIHTEAGREISRHLMDCKREVYLRRSQIAAEVFQQVEARLAAFTASPDYPVRLEEQLSQAVDHMAQALARLDLTAGVTVYLRPEDMGFSQRLARAIEPTRAVFQTGTFSLGGFIADCPELGQRLDASYDTALAELTGRFAELFGLSLADDLSDPGKDDPQ